MRGSARAGGRGIEFSPLSAVSSRIGRPESAGFGDTRFGQSVTNSETPGREARHDGEDRARPDVPGILDINAIRLLSYGTSPPQESADSDRVPHGSRRTIVVRSPRVSSSLMIGPGEKFLGPGGFPRSVVPPERPSSPSITVTLARPPLSPNLNTLRPPMS